MNQEEPIQWLEKKLDKSYYKLYRAAEEKCAELVKELEARVVTTNDRNGKLQKEIRGLRRGIEGLRQRFAVCMEKYEESSDELKAEIATRDAVIKESTRRGVLNGKLQKDNAGLAAAIGCQQKKLDEQHRELAGANELVTELESFSKQNINLNGIIDDQEITITDLRTDNYHLEEKVRLQNNLNQEMREENERLKSLYVRYRKTAHGLYAELNVIAAEIKYARENIAIAHTPKEWQEHLGDDGYVYIEESAPFTEEDRDKLLGLVIEKEKALVTEKFDEIDREIWEGTGEEDSFPGLDSFNFWDNPEDARYDEYDEAIDEMEEAKMTEPASFVGPISDKNPIVFKSHNDPGEEDWIAAQVDAYLKELDQAEEDCNAPD